MRRKTKDVCSDARIIFSLRNTYRVNSILHALKQIPLVRSILPETLYQEPGLKIFGNIISAIWEVFTALKSPK